VPGMKRQKVDAVLHLRAGKAPAFDTRVMASSRGKARRRPSNRPSGGAGDVTDNWFATARKIFHGIDDSGHGLTLLNSHSSQSHDSLGSIVDSYRCEAVIFGAQLTSRALRFDGVRFRFDQQDEWLQRRSYGQPTVARIEVQGRQRDSQITIPLETNPVVELNLEGYSRSRFFLGRWQQSKAQEFRLSSQSYLDLTFASALSWSEVKAELLQWRWFFSLATRTTVDIEELTLNKKSIRLPLGNSPMKELPVWMARHHGGEKVARTRNHIEFHFSFNDVASTFGEIIRKWKGLQGTWEAILHRFFAATGARDLSIHEQFLSLTQAIESLHRARSAQSASVEMAQAAKEAYLQSPAELQRMIGSRGPFVNQVHKSRNYWTHFGKPSPAEDHNVLDESRLIDLNEKLRWVVEAAILKEIGIPDRSVAKVWSLQWRGRRVEFH
jgi:hypothetical protein